MEVEPRTVHARLRFGLRIGLVVATVFSGWVTIIRLALGPHAFDRFGLAWGQVVALYYCTLALGGSAYGLVEPLRRHTLGSIFQWFLLILPMYVAVFVAMGLSLDWAPHLRRDVVLGLIVAAVGGTILGLWTWVEEREKRLDQAP